MYFDKRGVALIIYENALQYINKSLTLYFCIFFKNNEVLGTYDLSATVCNYIWAQWALWVSK